jgi:hypothetical protein
MFGHANGVVDTKNSTEIAWYVNHQKKNNDIPTLA